MHILIGDSGSTKTDWAYLTDQNTKFFTTQGLNPNHLTENEIKHILITELNSQVELNKVKKLFFYGAGLNNQNAKKYLHAIFEQFFLATQSIVLTHDLLAAAQALYTPDENGIVCILGTGSVAGYFDGQYITKTTGGLGYLLGDEGSGTYIGKLLIRAYAQQKLPEHLQNALYTHTQVKHTEILHFLYKQPQPNRFLAQLTHFLVARKDDKELQNIILTAFEDFYRHTLYDLLAFYTGHTNIRCVGSVAYFFEKELKTVMQKHGITVDSIIQKPLYGLVQRYKNTGEL